MAKQSRHRQQERKKGDQTKRLSAALLYASHGVPVVPLHGLKNSRCTCGDRDCKRPGGHARTKLDIADATLDREEIGRMWKKWPSAEIGIVMGWPGKLMALMTDGPEGWQTLRAMALTRERCGARSPFAIAIGGCVCSELTEKFPTDVKSPTVFEFSAMVILS
jgi:hypothetical protein